MIEAIPDPFPQGVISPFFAWWMALGSAAFFYVLFFTDWIPLKFDIKNPRERMALIILLGLAITALVWLLYVQISQGGVTDRWFPW